MLSRSRTLKGLQGGAWPLEILITTGFPDSVVQREGVPDLACAIVKKPYSDEELLQAVKRWLNGPGARLS